MDFESPLGKLDNTETQISNIEESTSYYITKSYFWYIIILPFFVIGIIFLGIAFINSNSKFLFISALFFLPIIISYLYARSKVEHQFMREFAAAIGYSYLPTGDIKSIKAKFITVGHSQVIKDILFGIHNGFPIRIFTYYFTVRYGRAASYQRYIVFEATFHSKMPPIILNNRSVMSLSSIPVHSDNFLQLEGDFNKYFSISVSKNYELEAYEIFTPDVMAILIDKAKKLNFEFIDDKLYIYTGQLINTKEEMENIFNLIDYLADLFEKTTNKIHIA